MSLLFDSYFKIFMEGNIVLVASKPAEDEASMDMKSVSDALPQVIIMCCCLKLSCERLNVRLKRDRY